MLPEYVCFHTHPHRHTLYSHYLYQDGSNSTFHYPRHYAWYQFAIITFINLLDSSPNTVFLAERFIWHTMNSLKNVRERRNMQMSKQLSYFGQKTHILVNDKAPIKFTIRFVFRGWTLGHRSAADPKSSLWLCMLKMRERGGKNDPFFSYRKSILREGCSGYRSSQNTHTYYHHQHRDIISKQFKLPVCLPTHNTEAFHEKNADKIQKLQLTINKRSESVQSSTAQREIDKDR